MTEERETTLEEKMELWKTLLPTDEKYLKEVSFGRTFKAIDPYYQIRKMTETFGPLGVGWWYTVDILSGFRPDDDLVSIKLTLYYIYKGEESSGIPILTALPKRIGKDQKLDSEAFKKATTDALTKAFSYLGCDAGVFLGEFDSNRYTDSPRTDEPATDAQMGFINKIAKDPAWKKIASNMGFNPAKLTKSEASQLIGKIKK